MRIGMAIYNFNPRKGGAERYAYDLAINLAKRGHEIYVYCSRGVWIQGIHFIRINTTPYPRWLRNFSFAIKHHKYARAFPLDVMLGFGNTLELDVYQSHGGVQQIWLEREIASYDNPREQRYRAFLLRHSLNQKLQEWVAEYPIRNRRYKRIVAISEMVKQHMVEHYGLKDTIDVVYNGVDTERFHPAEKMPEGIFTILFSAGNFRLKGLHPLLLAVKELKKETKGFQLLVMGRGRQKRYERLIDEIDIRDVVRFIGERSSPEDVYRSAHVLAHPTFYDACSLTTMEAMASGLPVITTRWNGASALITDKEGYVLEEPYDISGLSSAIKALFNEERRTQMGCNARSRLGTYTIERNVDAMEKIFFEVCNGG
ncbi:MAG TPA: hypothetical protein DDW17_00530 [Deltaproteobacteria bacterium]|nr:hypothetical protein [Deltaproteobacteria bacterium]